MLSSVTYDERSKLLKYHPSKLSKQIFEDLCYKYIVGTRSSAAIATLLFKNDESAQPKALCGYVWLEHYHSNLKIDT